MHIVLTTLGSRGDVQPYLALAVGLQRAGHRATLAAPEAFTTLIERYGVGTAPLPFDPQHVMQTLGRGAGGWRALVTLVRALRQGMQDAQAQVERCIAQADFFIQSSTGLGMMEAAGLRGTPGAFAHLFPFTPTRDWPMLWLPFRRSLGRRYNLITHTVMARALWLMGGPMVNAWRRRLGLTPWRTEQEGLEFARRWNTPVLYGYSPRLFPPPADWDALQRVTGYWFLEPPPDWQPDPALVAFLEAGPPPVYIGFGSVNSGSAERNTRLVLQALERAGQRGIVLRGWGGLAAHTPCSASVFVVDDVPHAWLFPHLAAVVHHGGAGTTGAGLRAGIPNIIVPFGGDQHAWAERVAALGVGLHSATLRALSAEALAQAIRVATGDPALRARAAALGAAIRAEDGLGQAIAVIEGHA